MKSLTTKTFDDIKTNHFKGAFAYDEVIDLPDGDWSIIVNTSPSSKPGEHWIAVVYKGGTTYFMDSYGRKLNHNETTFSHEFVDTMKTIVQGRVICNHKILQQLTSNACGYYALYFVERLSVESLRQTMHPFSGNLKLNDMFVYKYCLS